MGRGKIDNQIIFHSYKIQKLINLITNIINLIICILLKLLEYKAPYHLNKTLNIIFGTQNEKY